MEWTPFGREFYIINWQGKEIALLKKKTLISFKYALYGSVNL